MDNTIQPPRTFITGHMVTRSQATEPAPTPPPAPMPAVTVTPAQTQPIRTEQPPTDPLHTELQQYFSTAILPVGPIYLVPEQCINDVQLCVSAALGRMGQRGQAGVGSRNRLIALRAWMNERAECVKGKAM